MILNNDNVDIVASWLRKSVLFSILLVSPILEASPWLEAQDPFLRSSIVLLSDSGQIASPTGYYPLRWALFGDDLANGSASESYAVSVAASELQYSLDSARLNRGNRSAKFIAATEQPINSGFGQFNKDEWGSYVSYEHLDNDYAFRITSGYSKYNDENDIRWDDSYLSLNAGAWLFSIGNIDRWWGQGWQHNLILGSYNKATPDISASYINQNEWLGVWSVESFLAKPDDAIFDFHSATKVAAKPFEKLAVGVTYQAWFDDANFDQGDEQLALDSKLTLPEIPLLGSNLLYHNVYAEVASTAKVSQVGAWLIGWTGSFSVGLHTVRVVLESQQSTDHHSSTPWQQPDTSRMMKAYPGGYKEASTNTYPMDESVSAAFYLQLHNNHNVGFSYQKSEYNQKDRFFTQVNYRLPAFAGMVHAGLSYSQLKAEASSKENQTTFWTGYEFRF
ncbi:capsule assembly Wzi family protein [Vibrio sp. VB16]|uniref:capsule assembly Wzi family protein n=1 Tax=Vibrio sp. VB16 TaxID=2785746 RepID=UPI00189F1DE1|nr:capsule assembly Wzi family protein [Vibrio sp. VB16]UGA57367.1 capsule assembly Wzi family protein [Vibrio sp. VB16]